MDEVNHVNCCLVFVVLSLVTLVTFDIVFVLVYAQCLAMLKLGARVMIYLLANVQMACKILSDFGVGRVFSSYVICF